MAKDWFRAGPEELVEHIEHEHRVIRRKLSELHTLLEKASRPHRGENGGAVEALRCFCGEFTTALEGHFEKEEKLLLPYVRQMHAFNKEAGPKPDFHSGVKNPISELERDHEQTENAMFPRLAAIIDDIHLLRKNGDAFSALLNCLKEVKDRLHRHINLEEKALFPSAIELELQVRYK